METLNAVRRTLQIDSAGTPVDPVTAAQMTAGVMQAAQTGANVTKVTKPSAVFYLASSAANNNAQAIASGARDIHAVFGVNKAATDRVIRLYNKATTPAAASDTPGLRMVVPPGAFRFEFPGGYYMSTGVGLMIVTGAVDTDNTAGAGGDIVGLNVVLGAFA